MVGEGKYWIYANFYSNDAPKILGGFIISLKGDTIVDNMIYKKVLRHELSGSHPCLPIQMPCFIPDIPYNITNTITIGIIRELPADKRVYYRAISQTYCEEDEYLLFDFALDVGDELDECKKNAIGGKANFGIIDSVTVQDVYSRERRIMHTHGFVTYIGLPYEGDIQLIEGIGFDGYGLFHEMNNLSVLFDFCEGSLSDCNILSNVFDPDLRNIITIYPNPTNDKLYIESKLSIDFVRLFNIYGQPTSMILENNSVDISSLGSGVYTLEIITKEQKRLLKSIVIMH